MIVRPPDEWREQNMGKLWLLLKTLYGRRSAPKRWNRQLTSVLGLGFESCDAQPSLFYSKTTDGAGEVHVDDFDFAGPDDAVSDLLNELAKVC